MHMKEIGDTISISHDYVTAHVFYNMTIQFEDMNWAYDTNI